MQSEPHATFYRSTERVFAWGSHHNSVDNVSNWDGFRNETNGRIYAMLSVFADGATYEETGRMFGRNKTTVERVVKTHFRKNNGWQHALNPRHITADDMRHIFRDHIL